MLTAIRGGIGFLTRLPVGHDAKAWSAFRRTPVVFPLIGYVVGLLVAIPLVLPIPASVAAFLFPVWLYLVTGITHVDGLADLGDAMVVHGGPERRRSVMRDTVVGVGALLAVGLAIAGLVLAGLALARGVTPAGQSASPGSPDVVTAVGIVVAAEVGAKLGMVALVCLGTVTHEGMAAELTERAATRDLAFPALAALPAAALTWPHPAATGALLGALGGTALVWRWAVRNLGGVSGDVFGAGNEIARLAGLHSGVIVWTLW